MMPYYNLQVVEEVKTLSDVYADDEAALIVSTSNWRL